MDRESHRVCTQGRESGIPEKQEKTMIKLLKYWKLLENTRWRETQASKVRTESHFAVHGIRK